MPELVPPEDIVALEAYTLKLSRAIEFQYGSKRGYRPNVAYQDAKKFRHKLRNEWFRQLKQDPTFNSKELKELQLIDSVSLPDNVATTSRVVLVLKATRLCNLRCVYCNVWSDKAGQVMSFATIAKVVREALCMPGIKQVDFVWHGGEITILKPKFFRKLIALQERYRCPGQVISNSVQTNATNLTEEWLGLISVLELDVGISIDGPPEVHDQRRPTATGEGSSKVALEGLRRLRDAGVNHGVLVVVDMETMAYPVDDLLGYFVDSGIHALDFLNYVPGNDDLSRGERPINFVSFPQFVQWMRDVYRIWDSQYRTALNIRFIDDLSESLQDQRESTNCYFSGSCEKKVFTIDVDGSVSPCDKFIGGPASVYGSIHQEQLATIVAAHSKLREHADEAGDMNVMADCRWHSFCRGGCPHDRIAARRFDQNFNRACCGLSDLLDDIWSNECGDRSIGTAPKHAGHHLASINLGV